MHPVLQQVYDAWHADLAGKPVDWCQLHPRQDDRLWSIQGLVEHLALACRSSSRVLEKRLQKGEPAGGFSSPSQWLLQIAVLSMGRMPRGAPAASFLRPGQLHWPPTGGDGLLEFMRAEMERMDQLLDASRQRFGLQRVAPHFLLGPLRPDQWRRFHVIHFRHHLEQLHRIEAQLTASGLAPQRASSAPGVAPSVF